MRDWLNENNKHIHSYLGLIQDFERIVFLGNFILYLEHISKRTSINQSLNAILCVDWTFVDLEIGQEKSFSLCYWPECSRINRRIAERWIITS